MTLIDFARITRANLFVLLLLTGCGGAASYVITTRMPVVFTADASGYVVVGGAQQTSGEGLAADMLGDSKADSYLPLVTGRAVAQRAIDTTGISAPPAEVASRVSASVAPGSVILQVSATGPSAEEARILADAVVSATADEANRIETAAGRGGGGPLVRIVPIETALPGRRTAPVMRTNLLVGTACGLLVAYLIVLARRALDTRLRSVADAEQTLESPVLGVVPAVRALRSGVPRGLDEFGVAAEALRRIRTNLRYVSPDRVARSIVITSANPDEGKSTLSVAIARVLGEAGQATVIIDADMRRPTLATAFDRHGHVGLSQLLTGQVGLTDVLQDTDQDHVKLITAGRVPPNPSELLGSRRMSALIEQLSATHLVIIDAPPLLPVTDAGLLSGITDGTLLVVAVGRTTKEQARHCAKLLEQVGGRTLGVVLNQAPRRGAAAAGHGYGKGYVGYGRYAYGQDRAGRRGRRGRRRRSTPAGGRTRPATSLSGGQAREREGAQAGSSGVSGS